MLTDHLYNSIQVLLRLGEDGSPIYADEFRRMNLEVFTLTNKLFNTETSSAEEEGRLCLALLLGLSATIYSCDDKLKKIQCVLDRSSLVLPELENTVHKCELLLACYQVVEERELLEKAKEVIMSWGGRELIDDEKRMIERWNELSSN